MGLVVGVKVAQVVGDDDQVVLADVACQLCSYVSRIDVAEQHRYQAEIRQCHLQEGHFDLQTVFGRVGQGRVSVERRAGHHIFYHVDGDGRVAQRRVEGRVLPQRHAAEGHAVGRAEQVDRPSLPGERRQRLEGVGGGGAGVDVPGVGSDDGMDGPQVVGQRRVVCVLFDTFS